MMVEHLKHEGLLIFSVLAKKPHCEMGCCTIGGSVCIVLYVTLDHKTSLKPLHGVYL